MMRDDTDRGFGGTERFELVRSLGEGGMGLVYEAKDRESGQQVALKLLRISSPDLLARFKSEFREFQSLSHPNLVSLGELHQHRGSWFFTMELVEGPSFLEYVRGLETTIGKNDVTLVAPPTPIAATSDSGDWQVPGALNPVRLRSALVELAHGLEALHASGKVHRDLKPQNVRVTPQGRVVIIDFGLAIDMAGKVGQVDNDIVGTAAYMSPEQAAGRHITPASDWYAVGVMLYEAITGKLPYAGSAHQLLLSKQVDSATPVLSLAPDCPAELAQLTDALLRHQPSERPGAAEIRRVLEAGMGAVANSSRPSFSSTASFVGRVAESERLLALARQVQSEGTRVAVVVGESGLGKTSLTKQVARQILREDPQAWVIEGACYEREATPYKGLDGAIDMLAARLEQLPRGEVEALVPPTANLLAEFFPVLNRVHAFAAAKAQDRQGDDPLALRAELFRALRDLVVRVARRRRVVVLLDDVQWADADTWLALDAVMRPPDAPRILLLATLRAEPTEQEEWHGRLTQQLGQLEWLPLKRMSQAESEQLVRTVADRLGIQPKVRDIAAESGGNPLFIDALVRSGQSAGELSLNDALWERARQLSPEAMRVLEVVALSNGPIIQEVVSRAAELEFAAFNRHVGALRVSRLVHSGGTRTSDKITAHHDRVRTAIRAKLPVDRRIDIHRRTALALESLRGGKDFEALAWHWEHAGELARAAVAAEAAGDAAMKRLAFERAASHYRSALGIAGHSEKNAAQLKTKLAEALIQAGRGAEAASALRDAAASAPTTVALEMRRRAAEQLLRSGHIQEGLKAFEEVLAIVGEEIPQSEQRALLKLLWSRARLKMRGLKFKAKPIEEVSPIEVMRVDATHSVAQSLSTVDLVKGAELQTRSLMLALRLGDTQRVARALLYDVGLLSTGGSKAERASMALFNEASAMAEKVDDPNMRALPTFIRGVIAFQNTQWRSAADSFERALDLYLRLGLAAHWEISSVRIFLLSAWFYLGRFDKFLPEVPRLLEECARRGDVYGTTNLRMTHFCGYWLAADRPSDVHQQVDAALAEWVPQGYLSQHYYALVARVTALLYEQRYADAENLMAREWPHFQKSLLPRVQFLRIESAHLRGRVALTVGNRDVVDQMVSALRREKTPMALSLASLLAGAQAYASGDRAGALSVYQTAAQELRALEIGIYAKAAQWRAALWRQEQQEAFQVERELSAQGFLRPERYLAVHAPETGES